MGRVKMLRHAVLAVLCELVLLCMSMTSMTVQADETAQVMLCGQALDTSEHYNGSDGTYSMSVGGGTATLSQDKSQLTLRGVRLTVRGTSRSDACGIQLGNSVTTIVLEGENTITCSSKVGYDLIGLQKQYGGMLTLTGDGSLTIDGESVWGIFVEKGLRVTDTTLIIRGVWDALGQYHGYARVGIVGQDLEVTNSTVDVTGYQYGVHMIDGGDLEIEDSVVRIAAISETADKESGDLPRGVYLDGYTTDVGGERQEWVGEFKVSGTSEVTVIGGVYRRFYDEGSLVVTPSSPQSWVDAETGDARDGSDAVPAVDRDGNTSPFTEDQTLINGLESKGYIHLKDAAPQSDPDEKEDEEKEEEKSEEKDEKKSEEITGIESVVLSELPCDHRYAWETYKVATATRDGMMRYRCVKCGTVDYEVPTVAYYVFNKETQESIRNAAAGATVTIDTPIFVSFHEMVKDALIERSDVTLIVNYHYEGRDYEMTIPAGSGDALETLFGDSRFAGFRYLGGTFVTTSR